MTAAEILRELVAIPTPSSVSNLSLLGWVSGFLEPRGWRVQLFPYEDDAGVAKANLVAWPGVSEQPKLVDLAFVCHTDTVPYAAGWDGALVLERRGDALHGCGSCDVKGALACFLAAVSAVAETHLSHNRPNDEDPSLGTPEDCDVAKVGHPDLFDPDGFGSVALILTADEEIGCRGMERLLGAVMLRIGSAIVSEPTSLRAGIAGKGYGLARVTVEGREAHSAFPQQGVSAIAAAARLVGRILASDLSETADSKSDTLFDPPRTTLNIGLIEGGTAKNIVPGRCWFLVEWRAVPGEDPAAVLGRLRTLAAEEADGRIAIQVEGMRAEAGFSPAARGPLQLRLTKELGVNPFGISFGSEASRLARIADEVIVIGPGDMRTAHSDRECVPIGELERWTGVLVELLCGRSDSREAN
jgi:acetylornithine deacetylase